MDVQNLAAFRLPPNFRGRSAVKVQLWWLVQSIVFRASPQALFGFRRWLLRLFGARIGKGVLIRSSVTVTYPWKVQIGDFAWIGDDVVLYSLGAISIGSNAVVSQKSYLCAATHDFRALDFSIHALPVIVEDQAWLATDVFVAPGVTIGRGAVIGARSSVFSDVPAMTVAFGCPATPRYARTHGQATADSSARSVAVDGSRPCETDTPPDREEDDQHREQQLAAREPVARRRMEDHRIVL
jgi:putative colanic acid biosynthesis acetyltransferase WcaF